ncbi:hypothetical protein CSUI_004752, partial [Cystoisospora suis]
RRFFIRERREAFHLMKRMRMTRVTQSRERDDEEGDRHIIYLAVEYYMRERERGVYFVCIHR